MVTYTDTSLVAIERSSLRPLDLLHDLNPVANLIELCFSETMDADGREYLRQMRRMANDSNLARWVTYFTDQASMPLTGFVWEEDGEIVGNLSLIPITDKRRRIYLIANVAVHPNYRRRGIARTLTEAALEYTHQRGNCSSWLQVRAENQAAFNLYTSLGFKERARRNTWQTTGSRRMAPGPALLGSDIPVSLRFSTDWPVQEAWLNRLYPPDVTWNLPIHLDYLGPGLWKGIIRFINDETIRHWAARVNGELAGVLTWQPTRTYADNLWLATPVETPDAVVIALLRKAMRQIYSGKPLALNLPVDVLERPLRAAGFVCQHTLVWMEVDRVRKIEIHTA